MIEEIPVYLDNIPLSDKIKRLIWSIVYTFLFKPLSLNIFNPWRILLLKLFGSKIGKRVIIHSNSFIPSPWNLEIGEMSTIGPCVKLHFGKTIIGSKVTISKRSYLCSASHEINSINTPFIQGTIIIEDFVWIAAEAFIMMNVTIRQGAVVGARAAVFKDVDPWTVVGGNPAKFIKNRFIINEK